MYYFAEIKENSPFFWISWRNVNFPRRAILLHTYDMIPPKIGRICDSLSKHEPSSDQSSGWLPDRRQKPHA